MTTVCRQCDAPNLDDAVACELCGVAQDQESRPSVAPSSAVQEEIVLAHKQHSHAPPVEPQPMFSSGSDLNGIGGWLILPCIGLAISPFSFMHGIYTDLHVLSGSNFQSALAAHPALAALIMFEAINNSVLLAAAIFLNVLLYRKKRAFPMLMVIYLAANFALSLTDHLMAVRFYPHSSWIGVERGLIAAAFWIPYFLQSQRVEETFVN